MNIVVVEWRKLNDITLFAIFRSGLLIGRHGARFAAAVGGLGFRLALLLLEGQLHKSALIVDHLQVAA